MIEAVTMSPASIGDGGVSFSWMAPVDVWYAPFIGRSVVRGHLRRARGLVNLSDRVLRLVARTMRVRYWRVKLGGKRALIVQSRAR